MKKKVGILTLPLVDNYGGLIQRVALYYFLEKNGFEPYIIDKQYDQSRIKVLVKKVLSSNPFYKIFDYNNHTHRKKNLRNIDTFCEAFFKNKTKKIYNESELLKTSKIFDSLVVGSDQVWRYKYVKNDYKYYFLSFGSTAQKKISYAASFGVDHWEGNDSSIDKIASYLKNFDAISVREDKGVTICKDIFGISNVKHVLDPTLLPEISFYEDVIKQGNINKNVGLFNYVLDLSDEKRNILSQVSKALKLNESTIHLEEDLKKSGLKPSISEWLYHFKNADYIITDSFHGTVFSIIFNKQFIAIGNKGRGIARFTSLLKLLNLESRLILEEKYDLNRLISEPIDYDQVNSALKKLKKESSDFLINNLK